MARPGARRSSYGDSPSVLIVGRLAATALTLVSAPIIARSIGPEGRGETAAALALFLIIPVIVGIGMPLEVRRLSAVSNTDDAIRSARRINAVMTIAAIAIAFACYFTVFSSFDTFARAIAFCGVALSAIPASWALDVSFLIAHERFLAVVVLQLVQPAAYVVLIVVFWTMGIASVATVLLAYIVGNIANFIAGLALTRAPCRGSRMPYRPLLRNSLDFYGGTVAQIASSRLDQVLALPLIGAVQAGYYSVAVTVGSVAIVLGHALGGSYFRTIARSEGAERRQLQTAALRSAIAISLMFCPVLALASWLLIPIIFGSPFAAAVPATMVAILSGGIQLVAFVGATAINADGRGRLLTWAQIAGLAVGIGGLVLLGQVAGAVGAAIASASGFMVTVAIMAAALRAGPRDLIPTGADFTRSLRRLWRG